MDSHPSSATVIAAYAALAAAVTDGNFPCRVWGEVKAV